MQKQFSQLIFLIVPKLQKTEGKFWDRTKSFENGQKINNLTFPSEHKLMFQNFA